MGMSTHVVFLRSKDDPAYKKMLAVKKACDEAGYLDYPKEVAEYFGGRCEAEDEYPLQIEYEAREWSDESSSGYEIDIEDIPAGCKTIRFYNSW